jgi:hypothetical protein
MEATVMPFGEGEELSPFFCRLHESKALELLSSNFDSPLDQSYEVPPMPRASNDYSSLYLGLVVEPNQLL